MGDVDIDALEVVGAGSADGDVVVGGDDGASGGGFERCDLGRHGHSLLSDRWAGIANRCYRKKRGRF